MSNRVNCIIIIFLYVAYAAFFAPKIINSNFFVLDWTIFLKLSLFVFPLYILVLWRVKEKLTAIDYSTIYVPFFYWISLTTIFGGKSATNFFVVDLPIVGLTLGLYFLKIPLKKRLKIKNSLLTTISLWATIFLVITIAHFLIPTLNP